LELEPFSTLPVSVELIALNTALFILRSPPNVLDIFDELKNAVLPDVNVELTPVVDVDVELKDPPVVVIVEIPVEEPDRVLPRVVPYQGW
jgi:hypothetical protein